MLGRLCEYADRIELPPPAYKKTPVPWIVDLTEDGHLLDFVSTSSGQKKDRGKEFLIPNPGTRTSGDKPNLLADKAEYALGLRKNQNSAKRYREFVSLVKECFAATNEPAVASVVRFLDNMENCTVDVPAEITPDHWVAFRVGDRMVTDLSSVKDFWYQRSIPQTGLQHECLICGTLCQPANPHPVNIKGIPGGQTAGMALISANSNAFESFGMERSMIAPTCYHCAERYATALNSLITGDGTHYRIGPLIYLFWTKRGGFSPVSLFQAAAPDEVKQLLASVARGHELTGVDEDAFYATALSASGGRVVVRHWIETTVREVSTQIARWFRLQRIVENDGEEGRPITLFPLAACSYRDAGDMSPNMPQTLLEVALNGGSLPDWLLFQAVKRNRAEQQVTRPRAALIKMVILSKKESGEDDHMEKLDIENRDPAYLCGRLLAELEAVQREAMPGVNTTIVDRFFGTASAAPASVFGPLLRGAQNHLGKLRKVKPGAYQALQDRLGEIQANLIAFPKVLSLQQQGLFALGYYHQRAADRAAARAYKHSSKQDVSTQDSEGGN